MEKPDKDEYRVQFTKGNETIVNFQIVPSQIETIISLVKTFFSKKDEKPKKALDKVSQVRER